MERRQPWTTARILIWGGRTIPRDAKVVYEQYFHADDEWKKSQFALWLGAEVSLSFEIALLTHLSALCSWKSTSLLWMNLSFLISEKEGVGLTCSWWGQLWSVCPGWVGLVWVQGAHGSSAVCCYSEGWSSTHLPLWKFSLGPDFFYLRFYTSCMCSQLSLPKEQSLTLLFSGPQPEKGRDSILTAHVSTQDQHLVLKDAGFPHEVPTSSKPEVTQTYFQCKSLNP